MSLCSFLFLAREDPRHTHFLLTTLPPLPAPVFALSHILPPFTLPSPSWAICPSILLEDALPSPPTLPSLQEIPPSGMAVPSRTLHPSLYSWGLGILSHPFPWEAPSPTVGKGGRASPSGPPMFSCQRRELPLLPPNPFPLCCPHPQGGGSVHGGRVLAALSPHHVRDLRGTLWEGHGRGEGWRGGGRRSRWAPTRPLPLVGCPPSAGGPARRPSIKGLFILDGRRGVGEGAGGGEGGGEVGVGRGKGLDGGQRGAERRDKAKRGTITKENTKKKKKKPRTQKNPEKNLK
ncbi:hypothetical protein mRhiFer1_009138 [Rhinolophus ferrumequinum]|uniref:Uncharacterized protein n=1 Tax=Rhinolophus ferrumequinum TaxID=59479 RepID=A0A7J7SJG0_RHIFE|nr:hypothetical protein mRhiFer1_009138 [Rhinolophus ferrumequinum]